MKRFVCVLSLFVLLFASSSAEFGNIDTKLRAVGAVKLDLSEFNMYASVFGEPEFTTDGTYVDGYTLYKADGCTVAFWDENLTITRIAVIGDGVPFLAYSMAAIMFFCPDSAYYTENAGNLFSSFILARSNGDQYGATNTGMMFAIQKRESDYMFIIGK